MAAEEEGCQLDSGSAALLPLSTKVIAAPVWREGWRREREGGSEIEREKKKERMRERDGSEIEREREASVI